MNVYSEVNIIQTFPLPLGFGLNMASCFGGRSFPWGSPLYANLCTHAHCVTDWGQGDRKWDNTWVAVVTVVCGFQQRGVTISGKRHPVLPKKPLGSSTFLDISIISWSVYSEDITCIPSRLAPNSMTGCNTVAAYLGIGEGITFKSRVQGSKHFDTSKQFWA